MGLVLVWILSPDTRRLKYPGGADILARSGRAESGQDLYPYFPMLVPAS
jgi:hypothetical protein